MTTTVRFNTTMGNTGPPIATGEPVTPTTTFDGRYDFRRSGSIMVTPGPNRFGGTMQFFYGPNQRYYQLNTIFSVYLSKAYGNGRPALSTHHESQFGEIVVGRTLDRYRMTTFGYARWILTPTSFQWCSSIASVGCEYYLLNVQYLSTIVPFTTGMITGYQPLGRTTTIHTLTGYDNRTPAGLNGVISLVRPRLVHAYLVPWQPDESIWKATTSSHSTWQIDFHFLPEPGGSAMLVAGVVALAGLYRRRRHSGKR
jgi:MYXO-CTERM domain-containing protein